MYRGFNNTPPADGDNTSPLAAGDIVVSVGTNPFLPSGRYKVLAYDGLYAQVELEIPGSDEALTVDRDDVFKATDSHTITED